ncbi:MAG: T9SS type A sorting domain-containing protein, partial [Fibrobacter sp.]|nr:T9SS type A sorting domain-containing protein [Fibrobacter sp.]
NVTYPIPDNMVKGKKIVRISFTANSGMVGGIYSVRLLRNKPKPEAKDSVPTTVAKTVARPDLRARIYGGELQIEAGAALSQGYTARIYGMNGRLVKSQPLAAGQSSFSIGIGDMKNGTYILKIQRDGFSYATTIFRKSAH